ncbi:MAG TPA: pseudouridine synthase [Syntrophomonadaceae bacterium]|nr:pseudouridine synthase [Syntrophomonadaceae bacterium]
MNLRLAKYLAQTGVASRRKAEELIVLGRIQVNGRTITELGTKITPGADVITLDGRNLVPEEKIYLLLNKPSGYLCTLRDPQGRPTVAQLVADLGVRLYPVGRLDYDTEGLLLMTTDGDFANMMIHPRYGIKKRYHARIKGPIEEKALGRLRKGVHLEDGVTSPARVSLLPGGGGLEIEISEGKKREVRRMCQAVGLPLRSLQRVGFSFLTLQGVALGKYRFLSPGEVEQLKTEARTNAVL